MRTIFGKVTALAVLTLLCLALFGAGTADAQYRSYGYYGGYYPSYGYSSSYYYPSYYSSYYSYPSYYSAPSYYTAPATTYCPTPAAKVVVGGDGSVDQLIKELTLRKLLNENGLGLQSLLAQHANTAQQPALTPQEVEQLRAVLNQIRQAQYQQKKE